jgi:hypothetical protein
VQKFDVQIALEGIAEAKTKWTRAFADFNAGVETAMTRLIHEAAANFMSAEEVAKHSGLTVKRVRILMRAAGLDPKHGKRLLSKNAATALAENAALLGIQPHEMDLTSPLAYLPMGSEMREFLETANALPPTGNLRDKIAGAIYDDGSHDDWLTTIDGSPNQVAYALADRVLSVLVEEGVA